MHRFPRTVRMMWAAACRLRRRMAQRALQDICASKQGDARAAQARDAVATGDILAAVGVEVPEAAAESDEEEEAALPAWMEQSDGRLSPPLEAEAAVAGAVVGEEEDRALLLALRKQVRPRHGAELSACYTCAKRSSAGSREGGCGGWECKMCERLRAHDAVPGTPGQLQRAVNKDWPADMAAAGVYA